MTDIPRMPDYLREHYSVIVGYTAIYAVGLMTTTAIDRVLV